MTIQQMRRDRVEGCQDMLYRVTVSDSGHCRRTFGRRYQESLVSDLGPVLDLSPGGMRILASRVPSGEIEVSLLSYEGSLMLRARVVWSKRRGFGKREIGVEFLEMDEQARQKLTRISSSHRYVPRNVA